MENKNTNNYQTGEPLFTWKAHDYHPHERGVIWMVVFCLIFGGTALWTFIADPKLGWITSMCILITAAVYFWIHRNGNQDHDIILFEKGLLVDGRSFTTWSKFEGYWFIYEPGITVVNFEYTGNKGKKITLQLGEVNPDDIRLALSRIDLTELNNKKEGLLDLWIRILKL